MQNVKFSTFQGSCLNGQIVIERLVLPKQRLIFRYGILAIVFFLSGYVVFAQSEKESKANVLASIKFTKKNIASENYESVGVFDLDNDGILDVVSGGFWYEVADWQPSRALPR